MQASSSNWQSAGLQNRMLGVRIPPGLPLFFYQMNLPEKPNAWVARSKQFYLVVRSEMKKVSWPAIQEIFGTSVVVIAAVFFFGLYLGLVYYLLTEGLGKVLSYFGGG